VQIFILKTGMRYVLMIYSPDHSYTNAARWP
jgi:hypothetical protein